MRFMDFLSRLIPLDLFTGLGVTGGYLLRKKYTVQYPEKRLEPPDRFRGMFGYNAERCIDCALCAKACPIDIIHIRFERYEDEKGKKKKRIASYDIDVKRCMFCGLCEEACPTEPKAVWLTTKTYELATYERDEQLYFTRDRLESWDGVQAYPGVVAPSAGQSPGDPTGAKSRAQGEGEESS
jgi:NADH-quinone oxidoreductase subunit I